MQRLQNKVSSIFYYHGLVCASHPFAIISFVISILLFTWYPLTGLSYLSNAPLEYQTSIGDSYQGSPPNWFNGYPYVYATQLIFKTTVYPWNKKVLIKSDAFRATLHKAFDILDQIRNFQAVNPGNGSKSTLSDVCYHASQALDAIKKLNILPESGCLILSPTNIWGNNKFKFMEDPEIVKTIFNNYGSILENPPNIRDHLFGLPLSESGVNRIYFRNRQRIITFAFTLFLKKPNVEYLKQLDEYLRNNHPITRTFNQTQGKNVFHLYFKNKNLLVDYTPLILPYIFLFLYLYFSVSKIEMVKSKWGLAFSAVFTVFSSLLMSIGICTFFGMSPTLSGSEILPYLVVIIGIENTIVVTKSVVSTPFDIEVKYRVAKGLKKEGWPIFKNLIIELTILAAGFATFVQAIQEFCLFAVVGLLTDFFLQMFFYATVLSVDMRRLELSDLAKHQTELRVTNEKDDPLPVFECPVKSFFGSSSATSPSGRRPSKATNLIGKQSGPQFRYIPRQAKRIRVMDFLARTRLMQRALMVCFIVWVILFLYKSGLMGKLADFVSVRPDSDPQISPDEKLKQQMIHTNFEHWRFLSHNHFPGLFSYYNISLDGRYISILPSNHFSIILTPNEAIELRHQEEGRSDTSSDEKLDISEEDDIFRLYPNTKKELSVTIVFVILSSVIIAYMCAGLCRFMCSRRYERSQRNWWYGKKGPDKSITLNGEPKVLFSQTGSIDLMAVDGSFILSCCLSGKLSVFDSLVSQCINTIDRKTIVKRQTSFRKRPKTDVSVDDFNYNFNFTNVRRLSKEFPNYSNSSSPSKTDQEDITYNTAPSVWSIDLFESKAVAGCEDGVIEVWDMPKGTLLLEHSNSRSAVTYVSISSRNCLSGRLDGTINIYKDEKCQTIQPHSTEITSVSKFRSHLLTGGRDETVKVIFLDTAQIKFNLRGHSSPISKVFLDENGAVSVCSEGHFRFWDVSSGTCTKWIADAFSGSASFLSANQTAIVVATDKDKVYVCDRETGKIVECSSSSDTCSILLSDHFFVLGSSGLIEIWDTASVKFSMGLKLDNTSERVNNIQQLSDGSIVCSSGPQLRIIDLPILKTE